MPGDFLAVDENGREVVDALEDQERPRRGRQRVELEGAPVPPVSRLDPEAAFVVFAKEGVGNAVERQEVGADVAGDGGRQPFFYSVEVEYVKCGKRAARNLSEVPLVVIEAYRGSGRNQNSPLS